MADLALAIQNIVTLDHLAPDRVDPWCFEALLTVRSRFMQINQFPEMIAQFQFS